MVKPLIFFDPYPRTKEMVLSSNLEKKLKKISRLKTYFGKRAPINIVESILPDVEIIVGQTSMDRRRLKLSKKLKAIINVKGNWENNIDYKEAYKKGIYVLSAAPAMAPAVAEACIGHAIALSRNTYVNHRDFILAKEKYGIEGNRNSYNLYDANVGFIGFGNLAKSLIKLLKPFNCKISSYDPWLKKQEFDKFNVRKTHLNSILKNNQFIFILSGVTKDNINFLNRTKLKMIKKDASVILISRAEVVDFEAFVELAEKKYFRAAIDVFPEEPVPLDSFLRKKNNIIFNSHLAGGMYFSYMKIRDMMFDDISRILKNKKPRNLEHAIPDKAKLRIDK